jgi:hypothetical protein
MHAAAGKRKLLPVVRVDFRILNSNPWGNRDGSARCTTRYTGETFRSKQGHLDDNEIH